MRAISIAIAASALIVTAPAQNHAGGSGASGARAYSGGFSGGRGSYSGVGRGIVSPPAGSIINPGLPNGLNWNSAWRGYSGAYRGGGYYGGHRRGFGGYGGGYILSYPVFVGPSPYDYNYLPPGYSAPPPGYYDESQGAPPAPAVVINQNFVPETANPVVRDYGMEDQGEQPSAGMRNYQNMPPRQAEPEATMYLIAFKDHTVVPALGWWVEGNTIKYVNLDHDINQASLDLIDRDLSRKLNAQRNVDFTLPPAPPK
ncbi:MAG TPA: hypothetical protein VFA04_22215 [Bryobacteraceae bacterium]|jgi:hypothetical protein|nr:hypothetical protein [Bryobacteraceae bacterium]